MSLHVSKTGLDAQQMRISVIANNLANVNTVGFKRAIASMQDLSYQNLEQPGAQASSTTTLPSGLMLGTGVRVAATEKLFSAGNLLQTENPMDLAINGRGFFQILMPDGSVTYTRNGQFQVDQNGQMVTATGLIVQPNITVPAGTKSFSVGSDGTVSVLTTGNTTPTQIGQLQLADFINPAGLEPIGDNLFIETAASGPAQLGNPTVNGLGRLNAGMLESSNVNVVEELVNMIEAQRAYEVNAKGLSIADKTLETIIAQA